MLGAVAEESIWRLVVDAVAIDFSVGAVTIGK